MFIDIPSSWASVAPIRGDRKKLPAGNYTVIVTDVEVGKDFNNHQCLIITVDISGGEFAGFYADAKYNYDNSYRISTGYDTEDREDMGRFKGFIEMTIENNPDFRWNGNTDSFKGCSYCGRFGEVETKSKKDGRVYTNTRLRFLSTLVDADSLPILEKKTLQESQQRAAEAVGFGIPAPTDKDFVDDIPF